VSRLTRFRHRLIIRADMRRHGRLEDVSMAWTGERPAHTGVNRIAHGAESANEAVIFTSSVLIGEFRNTCRGKR